MVPGGLNQLQGAGHAIGPADVATLSPYLTRHIRRFGDYVLDLSPPIGMRTRGVPRVQRAEARSGEGRPLPDTPPHKLVKSPATRRGAPQAPGNRRHRSVGPAQGEPAGSSRRSHATPRHAQNLLKHY